MTRNLVEYPLAAGVNMALALRCQGVGTPEYLVNSCTGKWGSSRSTLEYKSSTLSQVRFSFFPQWPISHEKSV
ncbi:hypothetical protein FIBSPDRAFT_361368 [Athelia psychrophila]|uniref:Uncharacterized protein n=1 Tax=Athelia psychrophila TaxID=1759441 RepID=A0A167VM02_9AGAM|nr:hypothetical protein FIBSPDRAFT_361368 [Fibularhizoctonia sp. CBS 109695]